MNQVNYNKEVAKLIDHTILVPEATESELKRVCQEAKDYGFCTVCVNTSSLPFVVKELEGSDVKPIAVIGFPLGVCTTNTKIFETKEAVSLGAKEIDMVIHVGALKDKDYEYVTKDIKAVVEAAAPHKVKVIIETSKLSDEEKVKACELSKKAGAHFVKTSTGFQGGGATPEDIALMRKTVGTDMEVKASGGVRSIEDAKAVIEAGADRIGASSSIAIVTGKTANSNY